jgi:hypothetical protein
MELMRKIDPVFFEYISIFSNVFKNFLKTQNVQATLNFIDFLKVNNITNCKEYVAYVDANTDMVFSWTKHTTHTMTNKGIIIIK